MAADGKVEYEVRAKYDKLDSDLDASGAKIEKKTSKWDSVLQGVGMSIGTNLYGAAMQAAKAAWEMGTAFEDGLAKASTLIDTTKVDMGALGDDLLALSSKYGLEAAGLAESTYNAISANNALAEDTAGLMNLLESSAKLAKAGFTDIDTATSATLKTLNAYGLGVEEADRIQKIMMQTQNAGIVTVGELGAVLSNVTPAAAAMGVSFEEVGAAIATMTAQGIPAAQATTQINAALTALMKPNKEMTGLLQGLVEELTQTGQITQEDAAKFNELNNSVLASYREMDTLNLSTKEGKLRQKELKEEIKDLEGALSAEAAEMAGGIVQANGLQGTLELLNKQADGSTVAMAGALGSTEALKVMFATTGKNAELFTNNLASMSTETDVVGSAFDKVSGTNAEKLKRVLTQVKNIVIQLYDAFSPLISVVLDLANIIVDKLASAFSTVSGWIKGFTQGISDLWDTITGGGGKSGKKGNDRHSHASGLDSVPYNGYPATLHQKEMVLRPADAAIYRAGGNALAGRQGRTGGGEIDYEKLAHAMSGMTVTMSDQVVGRIVEKSVSSNQQRRVESIERSGFNGKL